MQVSFVQDERERDRERRQTKEYSHTYRVHLPVAALVSSCAWDKMKRRERE